VTLVLDLAVRAHPQAAEERHRRAPPLHGVLEEERRHGEGQREEAAMDRRAERGPRERERRRVRLDGPLDVPLAVEGGEPGAHGPGVAPDRPEPPARRLGDAAVHLRRGVARDAGRGLGDEGHGDLRGSDAAGASGGATL
jgi:hypothetical protein